MANGKRVAELLRNNVGCAEDIVAITGLSDEEKKALGEALAAPPPATPDAVEANRKAIAENEATLHQLHLDVMTNKEKLYGVRAIIEENRARIMENYSAA